MLQLCNEMECYEENCNLNRFTCRHEEVDPGVKTKVLDRFGINLPDVIKSQDKEVIDEPIAQFPVISIYST